MKYFMVYYKLLYPSLNKVTTCPYVTMSEDILSQKEIEKRLAIFLEMYRFNARVIDILSMQEINEKEYKKAMLNESL